LISKRKETEYYHVIAFYGFRGLEAKLKNKIETIDGFEENQK